MISYLYNFLKFYKHSNNLQKGGIFIFDISTAYKFAKELDGQVFVMKRRMMLIFGEMLLQKSISIGI